MGLACAAYRGPALNRPSARVLHFRIWYAGLLLLGLMAACTAPLRAEAQADLTAPYGQQGALRAGRRTGLSARTAPTRRCAAGPTSTEASTTATSRPAASSTACRRTGLTIGIIRTVIRARSTYSAATPSPSRRAFRPAGACGRAASSRASARQDPHHTRHVRRDAREAPVRPRVVAGVLAGTRRRNTTNGTFLAHCPGRPRSTSSNSSIGRDAIRPA